MSLRISHNMKDGRILYLVKRIAGLDYVMVFETINFGEARAFVLGWNEAHSTMSRETARNVKQVIACEP